MEWNGTVTPFSKWPTHFAAFVCVSVKPKVNVKPSVMKPAQRRKAAKVHSAVAEVKPLNSACQSPPSLLIPNKRLKVRFIYLSNSFVTAGLKK